ncbi:MAG TPA: FHA domain-containing protein [Candidatus Sumerlaeota bacterium]|nr:FHA domain-containing protein [Candidatus Sumerlaeota bacterium]
MTNELLNNSEKRENIPLMKAILGPEIGKSFFVSKPLVTFGRGEDRDLKFNDRAMSRKHGEIIFSEGRLIIRDTGSQNGIKINGRTTMEQELEDGDQIDIGSTRLVISIPKTIIFDEVEK